MNKKRSTRNEIVRLMKQLHAMEPCYFPLSVLQSLIASLTPYIALIYGAKIIDSLGQKENRETMMTYVIIMVSATLFLSLCNFAIDKYLIIKRRGINMKLSAAVAQKAMTMDYQVLEKSETLERLTAAEEGQGGSGGIAELCHNFSFMISCIISIGYAIVILIPFFSTKGVQKEGALYAFMNSPISSVCMIFMMGAGVAASFYIGKKTNDYQYQFFENNVKNNRIFSSWYRFISDYNLGKDSRIYHMQDFLNRRFWKETLRMADNYITLNRKSAVLECQRNAVGQLIIFAGYAIVGVKALFGILTLGTMTLYISTLVNLSDRIRDLVSLCQYISVQCKYLSNYTDFLDIKNEKYDGTLPIEKRMDNEYELEFRNVSFHYPNSEEMILKNVSMKLKVGRKLAIVGKNGAGKSTFIKLLCRLYDPTEGEILLNGIDIKKYDYDEYRRLFSVVFQDFKLYAFPVDQNVAAAVDSDEVKVLECLKKAGIEKQVSEMKDGIQTMLYKDGEEGVMISGGEAQKIAIARALYKDAPVVIMDEPTSALDPISELEIYKRFDEMVEEKTAIYISHRMSSCRFCNNILVFDNGNVAQMGTHEELLKDEQGIYYSLWNAQAQHYQ